MSVAAIIVDDSRETAGIVEELLRLIGQYEVVGRAATEVEGTALLDRKDTRWDLAIIDLVLREGSGFNLIRRYREASPAARIVVLSSYATTNIKLRCLDLGADVVFTKSEMKPFAAYLNTQFRDPAEVA